MAKGDLDKAKRLSPEERIRRLREIAERDEEEIRNAQNLIKESEIEIQEENKQKRQIPIPQLRSVDVGTLFGRGTQEDLMFKTKQFREGRRDTELEEKAEEATLEEEVANEPIKEAARAEASRQQYMQQLAMAPTEQLAGRMVDIYEGAKDKGYVSRAEMEEVNAINYALNEKNAEIKAGNYAADKKVQEEILASSNIMKALTDRYKGK
jgi:hypothetical protein